MELKTPESDVLTYAVPPPPVNTVGDIARRALLWTVMCSVCATPSFIWAASGFSRPAMICGVVLFIIAYTVLTSTAAFLRFRDLPFVRRTLYIGYGIRLGISIVFPVGMAIDLLPGMFSVGLVRNFVGMKESFAGTLMITIVQGTIINILLSILMAFIWLLQKVFIKTERQPQGFPVEILPSAPTSASENPIKSSR
jgi:hypothetical protein